MVKCLADIMQQSCPACNGWINVKFRGHHAGKIRDFEGMVQDVLAITGTVVQPSKQLHKFRMNAVYTGFQNGTLTFLFNCCVHFTAGFLNRFLNARGMDTPVSNQLFKCNARNFTPHRLKARKRNGFRSIINDEINTRQRFNRTDIAPFPTDNAPFHFIVWQWDNGNR